MLLNDWVNPRPETTRRPHFTSRRRWRIARLTLRAGVGRVKLMPLPRCHAQMCVEWSVCGTMCDMCWPSGGTCAVSGSSRGVRAPEMSVRGTQPSVSVGL